MKVSMPGRAVRVATLAAVALLALAACASQSGSSSSGPSSGGSTPASGQAPSGGSFASGSAAASGAAGAASGSAAATSGLPAEVLGATFVATQVGGQYSIVPGSTISLTFEDKTLAARAGCNNMFGPYTVDGNVLKVAQMGSTMMACDPALMKQDQWLSTFLASSPTWTYDGGTLQLTNGTDTMQLTEALPGSAAVQGVGWKLDGLISKSGSTVSAVDPGVTAWIEFQGSTVTVDNSCNTGSGAAEIGDTTITFGPIAMTLRACTSPNSDVQEAMTAVLQGVTNYTVTDDPSGVLLVIMSADGTTGLQFQADPSVGTSATSGGTSSGIVSSGPLSSGAVSSGG
jgi:heat shock protein HslJ